MTNQKWSSAQIPDQTGRVAIVTGGNSGIGFETVKALAAKGATVIVACRSQQRGTAAVSTLRDEISGGRFELLQLDLADQSSVRSFVAEFTKRFDRLDLLINNAGVMMPPERQQTKDGFELQFGTNHLGHFSLTMLLLDLLWVTQESRIVNVSSSAQNFGKFDLEDLQWRKRRFDRMGSYGASKIANMLFTLELQRRLTDAGVSTIAVAAHPGWTATNLQQTSPLLRILNPIFGMQPWQGALPTLYAATAAEIESGAYYGPDGISNLRGYPTQNKPAAISSDGVIAEQLWHHSEELVDIRWPEHPEKNPQRAAG